MKPLHSQEKEHFRKLFQQEDVDRFDDRIKILEIFLQTEKHVTVDELLDLLQQKGHSFQREFVRSTLLMMCRYGFAQKKTFENEPARYEHRHLGDHHDHMICIKCGKIIEFADSLLENLQLEIAANHGFHMLQHKMEIYGFCNDCRADRAVTATLESSEPGERVIITDILGGGTVQMRLMSMGIRRGDLAEIVTNYKNGQVVIALDQKRLSLGRGLARKIVVQPAPTNTKT